MPEIARLKVTVTAETGQAEAALDRVQRKTRGTVGALADVAKQAAGFGLAMAGVRALSDAFSAVGDAVIGFNARLEQSQTAWKTMLGSAEAAKVMLSDLAAFAAKTPFRFPELEVASRRLVAMGFAARDVIPLMEDLGNVAAGLGMGDEGINRLVLALGQMHAKTKVAGGEMRQLTEMGVPAWDLLAAAIGKSTAETMKLAEQGRISADVFIAAFRQFSQQNFGDMMRAQSRTFLGALSTIADNVTIVASTGFQPLFERVSQLAQRLAEFTQSADFQSWARTTQQALNFVFIMFDRARAGIGRLGEAIRSNTPLVAGLAGIIGAMAARWLALNAAMLVARGATLAMAAAQAALNLIMQANPIVLVISLIAGLVSAIVTAYNSSETFRRKVDEVFNAVREVVRGAVEKVVGFLNNLWQGIQGLARGWAEQFANVQKITRDVFDFIAKKIADFFNWLKGLPIIGKYIGSVGDWLSKMGQQVGATFSQVGATVGATFDDLRNKAGEAFGNVSAAVSGAFQDIKGFVESVGADIQNAWNAALPPAEQLEQTLNDLIPPTQEEAQAMSAVAGGAEAAAFSTQDLVNAMVSLHPAVRMAADQIVSLQRNIDSINTALRFHQEELRAAQAVYQEMQDRLNGLKNELSEAQRRLQELSMPRLRGMGELEMQISAVETQLKRIRLAEVMGVPLQEIIRQYPLLTEGAEAFLATLPQTQEELQRVLEQLRLTQSLKFDEQLKKLKEAATGVEEELTFEQALTQIQDTKARIGELTSAITAQEAAMRSQQAVIASIQATIDGLNATLQQLQAQLAEAQRRQDLMTQALQLAYTWLLEGRNQFTALGAEGQRVAGVMDQQAALLLRAVSAMATDTSTVSTETLAEMVRNYQLSMAEAILAVSDLRGSLNSIPREIETIHITRQFVVQGWEEIPRSERRGEERPHQRPREGRGGRGGVQERQFGGPIRPGRLYLVGERGPELILPTLSGTVIPIRNAASDAILDFFGQLPKSIAKRKAMIGPPVRDIGDIIRDLGQLPKSIIKHSRLPPSIDYDRLAQAIVAAISQRPTYVVNAQYYHAQDERSIRDDLRLLQLLGATL